MNDQFKHFHAIVAKYNACSKDIDRTWQKIQNAYAEPQRHYHNMNHINELILLITTYAPLLKVNEEVLLLTAFFHDIIYLPEKNMNEEYSAHSAHTNLSQLNVPLSIINKVYNIILATKLHIATEDIDTKFFLDADLSILGSDKHKYNQYALQIRKEYQFVSDEDYKLGRIKVLEKFIQRKNIYYTETFRNQLETKARHNIANEIKSLYKN